jgi:hypothetical protein
MTAFRSLEPFAERRKCATSDHSALYRVMSTYFDYQLAVGRAKHQIALLSWKILLLIPPKLDVLV